MLILSCVRVLVWRWLIVVVGLFEIIVMCGFIVCRKVVVFEKWLLWWVILSMLVCRLVWVLSS